MPTGPGHVRLVNTIVSGELSQKACPCRCMEGEDHIEGPTSVDNVEEPQDHSFAGAEEIYDSSGRDEDYDSREADPLTPHFGHCHIGSPSTSKGSIRCRQAGQIGVFSPSSRERLKSLWRSRSSMGGL